MQKIINLFKNLNRFFKNTNTNDKQVIIKLNNIQPINGQLAKVSIKK